MLSVFRRGGAKTSSRRNRSKAVGYADGATTATTATAADTGRMGGRAERDGNSCKVILLPVSAIG